MPDGFTIPTILVAGSALPPSFAPLSIDVTRAVNRIPTATISIHAKGAVADETPLMAGGPFKPAAEVEIKLRRAGEDDVSVFKGLVTAFFVHTRAGLPTLDVVVKDKTMKLTGARHSRIWTDTTDSDAIRSIMTDAELTVDDAPDTTPAHTTLVQHDCTDWDFILTRADAQGLAVVAFDGAVSLKQLAVDGEAAHSFALGLDPITDLHFELDAASQASSVNGVAWDPKQLAPADPATAETLNLPQGEIGTASVGDELGMGPVRLSHMVPLQPDEVKAWTNARAARARLALIRGRMSVAGLPNAKPMDIAKLDGLGDLLNGKVLVTGVRHRLDSHGFSTDLQFGLSPDPAGRLPELANMDAGGLLPPISGLHLGTIADSAEDDPEGESRIQVNVSSVFTDPPKPLWARIASPDAGDKRGFCVRPEPGDEVLVGFLGGDPRHPIVLGRLWGSKNKLPDGFTDAKQKGLVGRKDTRIVLSEADKPAITISTPGGRTVILDDKGESITLSDKNDNKLILNAKGITIDSSQDLVIQAKGAITIKGSTIDLN
ncbi:type VI secretion system tip protein VgrG [Bradyrhizobium oligotrophicum]|uniref:type VI secretion system tip protein VgrG n=1 Tax=Bradyrhizobium oligotrophicum TaxID=44255 RepID=UPI003EBAB69E